MDRDPLPAVARARVRALRPGAASEDRDDRVAVEEPLEVRVGGRVSTVLMRTPGHDEDLVRGFLLSEGIVSAAKEIRALRRPDGLTGEERGNVVAVELEPGRAPPRVQRLFYGSSSCGACGKLSIASLAVAGAPATSTVRVARDVLAALPDRMRAAQPHFGETGGLHASAIFDAEGRLLVVREDVGRHNALDKVLGWGLAAGRLPFADAVLLVSGRVSYEILQKAVAGGIPVVAAVGAPSSYAVTLAERFRVTLVGFLRGNSMNVYAGGDRIVEPPSSARPSRARRRAAAPRR